MDHEQAIHTGATERYILGELTDDERDRFEEHLFDCLECSADVKAAAAFVANARKVLAEAPAGRSARPVPSLVRLFWPVPVGSLAAGLVIAAGLVYQTVAIIPALRKEAGQAETLQPWQSYFLPIERSDAPPVALSKRARAVSLTLSRSLDRTYPFYLCDVSDATGRVHLSVVVPEPPDGREIELHVPLGRLAEGSYHVEVRGLQTRDEPRQGPPLARHPFKLIQ